MPHIQKITLQGFKSIKSLENFTLGPLNVFIGANGAGKSNFLEFFSMLQAMCGFSLPELPVSGLRNYVSVHGGCERLLFLGTQGTQEISCAIETEEKTYALRFLPTSDENLALAMMHDGSIRHLMRQLSWQISARVPLFQIHTIYVLMAQTWLPCYGISEKHHHETIKKFYVQYT